ncbi:efflux RND transporter periplasmic adaptor subunit [Sphingobacterium bovistauri]|uniref:Efflux RND transporter periplasmic adaptor subunit n=1 Tax=Sphingobacterium bovistauri TaxID=2781959 RepID=A0ABS7Z3U2_9SPHI|nr:efflux RND transporter periplasmic adaptor subunit [Sphingobacterium bovistauri]MCA5004822.1 efflux RND transporter periplasmic adaptor subunit [Sphingobacterium bovistauri]
MKKIINKLSIFTLTITLLNSCSSEKKEKENSMTNEQILNAITDVKAIGKVVPADDIAIISSITSGRVSKIHVNEGDSVYENQLIIELESGNSSLDIEQAIAQFNSIRAKNNTLIEDISKAEIYANELKEKYETSKKLFERNAETKENLDTDYSTWQQQLADLRGLRQNLKAQRITETEQQIQVNKVKNSNANFNVKAPTSGTITDLTAKLGQSVGASQELGKIINIKNPIIEAEVDELFANDIKVGQKVFISPIGRQDTIATGEVFFTNPILSNKSILYETANEGEDRRVRKIKIKLEQGNNLTINAKVDCSIRIR